VQNQLFYFKYKIPTLKLVCAILKSAIKNFKYKYTYCSETWWRGLLVKPRRRWEYDIKRVFENWNRGCGIDSAKDRKNDTFV
jgi:hypothetical protein